MKRISYNTVLGFFVLSTFWRKFIGRGKVVYCLLVCFGALVDLMVRVIRSFTGSLVSRGPVDLFYFLFYDLSSLFDALLQLFALSCPSLSNY